MSHSSSFSFRIFYFSYLVSFLFLKAIVYDLTPQIFLPAFKAIVFFLYMIERVVNKLHFLFRSYLLLGIRIVHAWDLCLPQWTVGIQLPLKTAPIYQYLRGKYNQIKNNNNGRSRKL